MRKPPTQVTLPGGFCIRVLYKTDRQIKASGLDAWGYWEMAHNGGKIILNKDAPNWRQLKTFGHEMVHATNDYAHWLDHLAGLLEYEALDTAKVLEEEEEE